jgi:hypothetical protein
MGAFVGGVMSKRLYSNLWSRILILAGATLALGSTLAPSVGAQMARDKNEPMLLLPTTSLPFAPREQLIYEANYSKFLLRGLNVAEIKFVALAPPLAANEKPADSTSDTAANAARAALVFRTDIASQGFFVRLFGITFQYHLESIVDALNFATERTNVIDEQGKRKREGEAVFDRKEQRVTWTERDPNAPAKPPRVVTNSLDDSKDSLTNDILTAVYFLRTQIFAQGRSFVVSVSHNGKIYKVPVRVAERTQMPSPFGKVAVWRLEFDVFGADKLIEGKGSMSAWFTDDARHLPVRAKLSGDLGTLELTLKKVDSSSQTVAPSLSAAAPKTD